MKKLLLFMLGWVWISCLSAQTQTLRANLDKSTTVEMTVRMENDIAYVRRAAIPFDAAAKHGIHDLAGVEFGEGTITIPKNGETYWIVPFNTQMEAINAVSFFHHFCFRCNCMENGECKTFKRECYLYTCDACILTLYVCNPDKNPSGKAVSTGPFVILNALQIIYE
ncbi:MAG: hypothetical protein R3D58_15050 [Saprospiraceae bacterium]